jgi:outer membrane protein assembly factor BamB
MAQRDCITVSAHRSIRNLMRHLGFMAKFIFNLLKQTIRVIKLSSLLTVLTCISIGSSLSPPQAEISDQIELSRPLILQWEFISENTINLTPATDGKRIYLPLSQGFLVSLGAIDGQLIWKMDIGGELSSAPAADEAAVYVASEASLADSKKPRATGDLRALGREGGITQWMRTLPAPIRGALTVSQGMLFGGASDGRVYAIRKKTGEILWVTQYTASFNSQPEVRGSRVYLGSEEGILFSIDQTTGKTIWRYRTRGPIKGRVAIANGMVFFGSADGYVYALDEGTGRLRWRTRTGGAVQAVAIAGNDGVLATSLDNFVYYLALTRGTRIWKHQLAGRLPAQPLTATDGALFIPLSSDAGIVLDLHDGKQLNLLPLGEDASIAASPIVAGKIIFVTTRHGLLAFSRPA